MSSLPERPRLAARVRLKLDRHEGRHVLLFPEKGLLLNQSSAAIAQLCDGEHSVDDIVNELAHTHAGITRERIEQDVVSFLSDLSVRGLLRDAS